VYHRLIQNIQTPFKLDHQSTRQDENHVHQALREALVNTLAHSDHETDQTIKITQYKDAYVFRNAGRLRVLREQLYRGGNSDPRNPNLLTMFQLLGLGERSGSGFPKIYRAWQEQHWILPLIREDFRLNTTELRLPLTSFIPQELEQHIINIVGDASYRKLDELARSVLIIIHSLGEVCNEDIQPYRQEHPHDISQALKHLVELGCLEKSGYGRGTKYRIKSLESTDQSNDLSSEHLQPSSTGLQLDLIGLPLNSEHSPFNSEHSPFNSEHLPQQAKDLINSTQQPETIHELANTKYISKAKMEQAILELCKTDWRTISELANLLNRKPDSLRNHYINPLLKARKLQALTPDKRNNPKQAYKSTSHEQCQRS
jgi:ATP-dependent DNA helicase RecG